MPHLTPPGVVRDLQKILDPSRVLTQPAQLEPYRRDATPLLQGNPSLVLVVCSTAEIAAIMKRASKAKIPVVPRGGGTGLSGGAVPVEGCWVLDTTRMNRILEIDRKNRTITLQPGVITATLQREVEGIGLFYPPDPGSADECTLGGNVAENAGGIRGLKYGVTRDYVLGMEVVLPSGAILKLGGKQVKDVAGYNIKDLLIGSEGTLAIFTELTLRLLPRPEHFRTWLIQMPSISAAGDLVSALLEQQVTPACLELMDEITWRAIQDYAPGEKTAAQSLALSSGGAMVLLELDGPAAHVDYESAIVTRLLSAAHYSALKARDAREAEVFKAWRRCAFRALSARGHTAILEDAAVPRSAIPEMIQAIEQSAKKHRVLIGNFGHAGDGNLHPTCLINGTSVADRDRAKAAFSDIYSSALRLGGTITGEHGVGLTKREVLPLQWSAAGIQLLQDVKAAFDPAGILNPGKIFRARKRCE